MPEESIQQLIDSIEQYDAQDQPPYYVLWYIDGEEYETPDQYFAVMAIKIKPDEHMMNDIKRQSKSEIGNMIYAADYLVYDKEDAIEHLESLFDD